MPALHAARSIAIAVAGFLAGVLLAAMAVPLAAYAKPPAPQTVPEGATTISIVVYGNDPCPPGKGDEIVVCARQPESERYRIPKRFRGRKQDAAPNNSWANKVSGTEDASRTAAGLPDTCSSVGTGGQSGCFSKFVTQANREKLQQHWDQVDNPDGTTPPN